MASDELEPLPSGRELNILLIGKTGQGKSETGNTILSEEAFVSSDDFQSVTRKNSAITRVVGGRTINVVDTPGCMDTEIGDEILKEISGAIFRHPEGYDAFVMVFKYPMRGTDEEVRTVAELEKVFGEKMYDHTVVVFTHGDLFEIKQEKKRKKGQNAESFKEFVEEQSKQDHPLGELFKKVNNRVAIFNNGNAPGEKKRQAVIQLVQTIDRDILERYDDKIFEEARKLKEENPDDSYESLVDKFFGFLSKIYKVANGVINILASGTSLLMKWGILVV